MSTTDGRPEAAVAYVPNGSGKILVVWNKRYGRWGMPGGKVETHESRSEAAVRELHEETGALVNYTTLIYHGPHNEAVESTRGSYIYVYRTVLRMGSNPHEREPGCPVTYFTRDEFLKWGLAPKFYERMFEHLDRL